MPSIEKSCHQAWQLLSLFGMFASQSFLGGIRVAGTVAKVDMVGRENVAIFRRSACFSDDGVARGAHLIESVAVATTTHI